MGTKPEGRLVAQWRAPPRGRGARESFLEVNTVNKNFVLDTNVLLHDPRAIYQFRDNNVIIPINVLEEVDQFKKELSERGRNARTVSRYLDELREKGGRLAE